MLRSNSLPAVQTLELTLCPCGGRDGRSRTLMMRIALKLSARALARVEEFFAWTRLGCSCICSSGMAFIFHSSPTETYATSWHPDSPIPS